MKDKKPHYCKIHNPEESTIDSKEGSVKGGLLRGGLLGVGLHSLLCPAHGLPAVAIAAGILPNSVVSPLYQVHDYVVHNLAEPVVEQFIDDHERIHDMAHTGVDALTWGIALSIPAYMVGKRLLRKNN